MIWDGHRPGKLPCHVLPTPSMLSVTTGVNLKNGSCIPIKGGKRHYLTPCDTALPYMGVGRLHPTLLLTSSPAKEYSSKLQLFQRLLELS